MLVNAAKACLETRSRFAVRDHRHEVLSDWGIRRNFVPATKKYVFVTRFDAKLTTLRFEFGSRKKGSLHFTFVCIG